METMKYCPFCGAEGTLSMHQKKMTRASRVSNSVVKAVFDIWTCSSCKESFFHDWKLDVKPKNPKI
jgi:transposase-like protein